ncbi:hypothetical protein E2C01_010702 [Portunus trituberculatus]|uniref:Uncharacterized protein n=1 Tax=Portunus trituberculatus TaxID=210409 RepID=A0A5B7D9J9_PORTR|nr:hypothetical protein [Portunus trituberculatus]
MVVVVVVIVTAAVAMVMVPRLKSLSLNHHSFVATMKFVLMFLPGYSSIRCGPPRRSPPPPPPPGIYRMPLRTALSLWTITRVNGYLQPFSQGPATAR